MPRTNKADDGTPLLSYADKNAERIKNGEAAIAPPEPVILDELDKAEVQEAILDPKPIEVKKLDGTIVKCKSAFGPADNKRGVRDVLKNVTTLFILQLQRSSADFDPANFSAWFARNQIYKSLATQRLNVKIATAEVISLLGNTSVAIDEFSDEELTAATMAFFYLYGTLLSEDAKQPKN